MLERTLLIRVSLPPLEIYYLFQRANLLRNLSSTPSHTLASLCFAPRGSPRYSVGKEPFLHPSSKASPSTSSTLPTGSKELFSKLIFKPKSASNQAKIQHKCHLFLSILTEDKSIIRKKQVCDLLHCVISPLKHIPGDIASFSSFVNH